MSHKIKRLEYRVTMFYLWIPTAAFAIERIKGRVSEGGHNVPNAIVRRRFKKSLKNLFHVYLPHLDHLTIFDNTTAKPRAIFETSELGTRYEDKTLCDQIINEAN